MGQKICSHEIIVIQTAEKIKYLAMKEEKKSGKRQKFHMTLQNPERYAMILGTKE